MKPIRTSPDGHYLTNPDGTPFFWLGDTAWQLFHRLDRDETERYYADRQAKGYNVIQAVATGKIYGDWRTAPNRYGHAPFIDAQFARPNPDYFAHVDWAVETAERYGLRIGLLPTWGAALSGEPGQVLDLGNAEEFGRFVGARYGDGVIWILGGDINPITDTDHRPVVDAVAAGILATAGPDSFLTYHPSPGAGADLPPARTSLYFGDRPWFRMNMLQSSHLDLDTVDENGGRSGVKVFSDEASSYHILSGPYNYVPVGAEYRSTPTRPVIDAEPCYEDHPRFREKPHEDGIWRDDDVRIAAYHAVFAGAAGHTYGHVSVWDLAVAADENVTPYFAADFARPDWPEALDAPGAGQMAHVSALILSRPYFTRIPDDTVVVGDLGDGQLHVSATRDAEGGYVMVYLPRGGQVSVRLDSLSGDEATGWWFDPRTGEATRIPESLPTTGVQEFTASSSGAGSDWVLVIDDASREFPPPGSAPLVD